MGKVGEWRIRLRELVHLEGQTGGRARAGFWASLHREPATLPVGLSISCPSGSWPCVRAECQAKGWGLI